MRRAALLAFISLALASCSSGGSLLTPRVPSGSTDGTAHNAAPTLARQYRIVDLGANAQPAAINNAGHVAFNRGGRAFLYDGAVKPLATDSHFGQSGASDINAGDLVAGEVTPSTSPFEQAALLRPDGSAQTLMPPAGNYDTSMAVTINDSGQIFGDASGDFGCTNSFVQFSTGGSPATVLYSGSGFATDANNSEIVLYNQFFANGGCSGEGDDIPYLYPAQTPVFSPANTLHGDNTYTAADLNDIGDVAGFYDVADENGNFLGQAGFLVRNGAAQEIDPPGGLKPNSRFTVTALNDSDWLAGSVALSGQPTTHAYVWISGTFTDLNTLLPASCVGWVLIQATDVSNTGFFTGTAIVNGTLHGFLLVPQS